MRVNSPRMLINGLVECDRCQVHNLNCERGTPAIQGFGTDGMFAEYTTIDYHNAIILPDNLPMETSAPYFCAGITAFHGVDDCGLKPGDTMAIVGCGGLGVGGGVMDVCCLLS